MNFSMKYCAVISFTDFDFRPVKASCTPSSPGTDELMIGVVPGLISPQGRLFTHPQVKGCDIAFTLPLVCTLSGFSTAAFSAVSLLRSLHLVDRILLPVDPMGMDPDKACSLLVQAGYFLFTWPMPFQQSLKDNLASDPSSYIKAQAAAVEPFVPGAGKLLSKPVNALAAEVLKVEKQLYCLIPVEFIPINKEAEVESKTGPGHLAPDSSLTDLDLYALLTPVFSLSKEDFDRRLENTAGGYGVLIQSLPEAYRNNSLKDLCRKAEKDLELRLFLLRLIAGISRGNSFICGLSTWTPYAKAAALTASGQKQLPHIQEASWTTLLTRTEDGWDKMNLLDDSVKMILEKDTYSSFQL